MGIMATTVQDDAEVRTEELSVIDVAPAEARLGCVFSPWPLPLVRVSQQAAVLLP